MYPINSDTFSDFQRENEMNLANAYSSNAASIAMPMSQSLAGNPDNMPTTYATGQAPHAQQAAQEVMRSHQVPSGGPPSHPQYESHAHQDQYNTTPGNAPINMSFQAQNENMVNLDNFAQRVSQQHMNEQYINAKRGR